MNQASAGHSCSLVGQVRKKAARGIFEWVSASRFYLFFDANPNREFDISRELDFRLIVLKYANSLRLGCNCIRKT